MTAFKCKMCGAPLEVAPGADAVTCDYCHTQQTLPRLDDERRANLYDRGNHFRRASEYDKAMRVFEAVLAEDPSDAEAYWSVVLCRYGVEYVRDPATGEQVPTVNRMQASSILADEDYRQALSHAGVVQRGIYERQAQAIAAIQEGIAEVAAKEEPFDVFICYKESDAQGRRTRDSVKAAELYHALTTEGFRVFYAPITLEDKLGQAYEPYIYSALQSAKAMVVVGSRPEHLNAPWVRNEWGRYLALIKAGAKKTLIPAYFDMDPYDLPEEFGHLQAQDMTKLGFVQDLVRGIKKICGKDERPAPAAAGASQAQVAMPAQGASGSVGALLKRISLFLADGDFDRAAEYAERVLDLDPTCAEAYLDKLMASQEAMTVDELIEGRDDWLFEQPDYEKAARFAKGDLAATMTRVRARVLAVIADEAEELAENAEATPLEDAQEAWEEAAARFADAQEHPGAQERRQECLARAEEAARACAENDARVERALAQAEELAGSRGEGYVDSDGSLEAAYLRVKEGLADLATWRGADKAAKACEEGARAARKTVVDERLAKARGEMRELENRLEKARIDSDGAIAAGYERIAEGLADVAAEWESAKSLVQQCYRGTQRCRESVERERFRLKRKRQVTIAVVVAVVIAASAAVYAFAIRPAMLTGQAQQLQAAGSYEEAAAIYDELGMTEEATACRKAQAQQLQAAGSYEEAAAIYDELGMTEEATACRKAQAQQLQAAGSYEEAAAIYDELGMTEEATGATRKGLSSCQVGDTVVLGTYEQDGVSSNGAEAIEWVVLAKEDGRALLLSKYALDYRPYNDDYDDVTWATCDLRSWLNGEFYEAAFSAGEQALVAESDLTNPDNEEYGTSGGADTQDRVFLLSIDEVGQYLPTDEERVCLPTAQAVANGVWTNGDTGACDWWLRSPGNDSRFAAGVYSVGSVRSSGWRVDFDADAVRPALWVNL